MLVVPVAVNRAMQARKQARSQEPIRHKTKEEQEAKKPQHMEKTTSESQGVTKRPRGQEPQKPTASR